MIEVFDLTQDTEEFVNLSRKPIATPAEKELQAELLEWMILERDFLPLPISNLPPKAKK